MARLLPTLLLLPCCLAVGAAGEVPLPPIQDVVLDAATLLADPGLLASDTLALKVTGRGRAAFKLSERGEVLAAGQLLAGENTLRFTRPGLFVSSQSLLFLLEALADGEAQRKFLRLQVTVAGRAEAEKPATALSGDFSLEMYHSGRLIGFRKKRMEELVKLTTGAESPPADPLAGSSFRPQTRGQSIPVLGMALALAKHLAKKQAEKRISAQAAETRKRRLETVLVRTGPDGGKIQVPVVIELRTE